MNLLTLKTLRLTVCLFGLVIGGATAALAQQQPTTGTAQTIQQPPSVADPKAWVGKFLQTLQQRGVQAAVTLLMDESLYKTRSNRAEIEKQLVASLTNAETLLGKISKTEVVETKKLGENLMRYRTLVHYQLGPVLVEITFHRPENKWIIVGYNINGSISVGPF